MAETFLTGTASITQNSRTLTITPDSARNALSVAIGTLVYIGSGTVPVGAISGTANTITLEKDWTQGTKTDVAFLVAFTLEGLGDAVTQGLLTKDALIALKKDNEILLNSDVPTVNVMINGVPVSFVPYKFLENKVNALVDTATGASDTLTALEDDVNTLSTTVGGLQAGVNADKNAAATSAINAGTSETNSASNAIASQEAKTAAELAKTQAETILDNFDDRYLGDFAIDPVLDNDGDPLKIGAIYWSTADNALGFYNGSAWQTPSISIINSVNSASQSASNAAASELLSSRYANYPEDQTIPGTSDFSAFHWKQKAQLLAGGTAPDSLLLGGQLPNYYAKQSDIDTINSTLSSDDVSLDTVQKIVDYAKVTRTNLNGIDVSGVSGLQAALALKADQAAVDTSLGLKVDKITGKGLSTNDYDQSAVDEVAKIANKADKTVTDTLTSTSDSLQTQINDLEDLAIAMAIIL